MTARLTSRLWRRLAPFRRSEQGATAVEFALVAGPFFFVLGCICETGLMLFTEYVIQNSVQEAARLVRTGQVSTSDGTTTMDADAFKTRICADVNIIIDCDNDVIIHVSSADNFAALTASIPDPLDVTLDVDGNPVYTPGGQLKAAAVIATYDWDFAFPFMEFFGNRNGGQERRIHGLAIFRNEPFGS